MITKLFNSLMSTSSFAPVAYMRNQGPIAYLLKLEAETITTALEMAEEDGCACIWRSGTEQDQQSELKRFDLMASDLRSAIIQEPDGSQRGLWIDVYVLSEYADRLAVDIPESLAAFLADNGPIELFLQRMVDSIYWLCHVRQGPSPKALRCLQVLGAVPTAEYRQRPYNQLNLAALERQIENQ